ncbi:Spc24-domain-containing protein [Teratosphaeria nubilosa]|uniref:Kinetochore protein Spc24 n=1 Tax=Teratosphaeria nubilosa TaxID=161662 RepID=A0A6G1LG21_9PEZI|nr:Spc24-domain-containing protein [Teratosphaeria nubilosa]
MVLFDESPVTLIRETTTQFHITPDKDSLTRISTSLSHLHNTRTSRLATHQNLLKTLSRKLNTLQSQNIYEEERHDAGQHVEEMLRLDTEKFRVAKGCSDAEIEGERLRSELAGLKGVLEGLEREGVEGGRRVGCEEEGEVALKLQFYRSLGIDISQDPTTHDFNRAVIRNTQRGDVNVVNVDGKLSQSGYVNTFWESM